MKMGFNAENHVKNLPDVYEKTANSNNHKILELERITGDGIRETLWSVDNILDINNAKGKTLDLYGERVGQPRGNAPDEKYILMIKAKIMRNLSDGSYQSVLNSICATFDCDPSEVIIKEKEGVSGAIESIEIPLDVIIGAGFTVGQTTQILESLMPVGVSIETSLYEGTFEFGETENEYDENAGFAISEDDQSIGGYLGHVAGEKNEEVLPI